MVLHSTEPEKATLLLGLEKLQPALHLNRLVAALLSYSVTLLLQPIAPSESRPDHFFLTRQFTLHIPLYHHSPLNVSVLDYTTSNILTAVPSSARHTTILFYT